MRHVTSFLLCIEEKDSSLLMCCVHIFGLLVKAVTPPPPPDSSLGRASAFGRGGHGFESLQHHTKGVKRVLAAPLLTLALKGLC